jgi:hypothetical protein
VAPLAAVSVCACHPLALFPKFIPPTQKNTNSASCNLNTAHYYNHNFYIRDECRIRQHSKNFGNNDEGATGVATTTSDTLPLAAIDPA